ncbi:mandelate racemase/muconate lactonizing enzyme family protein [Granulosicoccus sp. 3-233]|uniref:mandelate racemase/muconate lactonizing enzyme family protein n=1 Tax=Granulosicoccus sp. 3-233 TaxID=3417969 RepID=UPI003D348980
MTQTLRIKRIDAFSLRSPIDRPVATSFGTLRDRPAVFLRIEDADGAFGWGEVFANWPSAAAEHRVNLLARDIGPLAFELALNHPSELYPALEQQTRIVALQSGEWGPFRQVIAGLDIALWDLFARKSDLTLRHYINHSAVDSVPAYASGIHIDQAQSLVDEARKIGFRDFKLKVGFSMQRDLAQLRQVLDDCVSGESFAVDANQAWNTESATIFMSGSSSMPLSWLEEPIPANAPQSDWQLLSQTCSYPLAGGENLVGHEEYDQAIAARYLSVVQPDIIKWGGITGCLEVGMKLRNAGLRYCPHFLGGGIGLQASANLLAAVGGDGLLEVDVNPNPLRDSFGTVSSRLAASCWQCNTESGLGITGLPEEIASLETHAIVLTP